MLSNISWTTFLTTLVVVTILYYAIVLTLYYPKEILTLLLGRKNKLPIAEAAVPVAVQRTYANPIGNGERHPAYSPHEEPQSSNFDLMGPVSDLMEGIKTVFRAVTDTNGNKEELMSLFPSLLADYPKVATSKYRYSINAYIHDLCTGDTGFDITMREIDNLWPQVTAINS